MNQNNATSLLVVSFLLLTLLLVACGGEKPTATLVPTLPEPTAAAQEGSTPPPETVSIPPTDYQNITWSWVSFTDPVNGPQDIPQPERYQITLNPDGTISVKADCNMVSGTYAVEGSNISIELGPSTMAMCPEDSMADPFTQHLTAASIMFFDSGDMLFDTFADSGTMRFSSSISGGEVPVISQPIYRWGEVADRLWVLVGYGDAANPTVVQEGTKITAVFSSVEPTVTGSGGCNNYFASYSSTDEGGLTIEGPIGSTMMACETGMEQEASYFAALEMVTNWAISEAGRLELTYNTGQTYEEKLVYAPGEVPLVGTIWRLVSYGDPDELTDIEQGTSITAEFSPETDTTGTVSGNATCNSYTTGYTLDENQISFGPIAGTMMMCPVGAGQETAYLAALASAQTYQIMGPNMQISYDGGVLNFTSLNLSLEYALWQAVEILGEATPEGAQITAIFTPGDVEGEGVVGGNAVCNSYNTGYETDGESLTITGPIAMTMALCPDETLARLEEAYLTALEKAESYEILGDQLVLHTGDGDIQYAANREPLEGTLWTLISVGPPNEPQSPVEGSHFTAEFSRLPTLPSGTVKGTTGCNDWNATYTANLTEIKINLPAITGNEDCPWGTDNPEVEQAFFLGLNAATEYRIAGNVLQIPYGEGDSMRVMNFQATQPPVEEVLDLSPLDNTFWYLSAMGDKTALPGSEVTAGFEINADGTTGTMSGSGGCNAYNTAIGENFAVGPIASTARACETAVMDQESAYFAWLASAYTYSRAGDQLLISTGKGVLTYNSRPVLDQSHLLQNVTWYAISYEQSKAVAGSNPTAFFASDGRSLSGKTGCNDYTGTYTAKQGNGLTISGFAATQAACSSDALTRQEQAFLQLLPMAVSYSVNGNQLQVRTAEGGTLNFSAVPPAPVGPKAVIVAPKVGDAGQVLVFDGYQSTAGSAPIVSYEWDMGDGTQFYGPVYEYAYGTAGTYTVKLTVVDKAGERNTASQSVQINPVANVTPPGASIEGPTAAFVGEEATFSAARSQQGNSAIAGYLWQSGDGNNTAQVPENTFTTIYGRAGTYYPSVTVVGADGLSDSASMAIVINARLEGTDWILANPLPGTSITLNFANGGLSGFAGCNSYSATYITTLAEGPSNAISVGPISSTGQMCSEEIMDQEQGYLTSLESVSQYTIEGTVLTLTTASGPLTFNAAMATPLVTP
ncbi:MAG: META domain-containing protein [Anaerolineae bacterium]